MDLEDSFACIRLFPGKPAPTGTASHLRSRGTCESGHAREYRQSRCHPPRRLLRGRARSHRDGAGFELTLILCGSGHAREHRQSRCHPPRRLFRGHARSHRYCASCELTRYLWRRVYPRRGPQGQSRLPLGQLLPLYPIQQRFHHRLGRIQPMVIAQQQITAGPLGQLQCLEIGRKCPFEQRGQMHQRIFLVHPRTHGKQRRMATFAGGETLPLPPLTHHRLTQSMLVAHAGALISNSGYTCGREYSLLVLSHFLLGLG